MHAGGWVPDDRVLLALTYRREERADAADQLVVDDSAERHLRQGFIFG